MADLAEMNERIPYSLPTTGGHTFECSRRTAAHLDYTRAELAKLDGHDENSLYIMQGCYNTGVELSKGTHDFDAVLDVGISGMAWADARRFLRRHGWAAWVREPPTFDFHIHMISLGFTGQVGTLVPSQVADYCGSPPRSGLAGHVVDRTWHPKPQFIFDYDTFMEDEMPLDDTQLAAIANAVWQKQIGTDGKKASLHLLWASNSSRSVRRLLSDLPDDIAEAVVSELPDDGQLITREMVRNAARRGARRGASQLLEQVVEDSADDAPTDTADTVPKPRRGSKSADCGEEGGYQEGRGEGGQEGRPLLRRDQAGRMRGRHDTSRSVAATLCLLAAVLAGGCTSDSKDASATPDQATRSRAGEIPATGEPMQLDVLVYNVEYGGDASTDEVIRSLDADVVGVLESYNRLPQIAKKTGLRLLQRRTAAAVEVPDPGAFRGRRSLRPDRGAARLRRGLLQHPFGLRSLRPQAAGEGHARR